MIHRALFGVLKTQCTAWVSTLLTLSTCNSQARTAMWEYVLHYPGWHHPDANVFQQPEHCLLVEWGLWFRSRDFTLELGFSQRRPSKCFIIINFIHTATCGVHIFQMIILKDVFKFVNGNDIDALQMVSFYVIFCGQMKRILLMRVSSTSTSHLWERDDPYAMCEYGLRFTSASVLALESLGTLLWASVCYLPGWVLRNVMVFWKLFNWGC